MFTQLFTQLLFLAGNQGNVSKFRSILASQEHLTDSKMDDSKKLSFSILPILNIFFQKINWLVLGLVGLIDAKGIDVAQPIWLWECPT